MSKLRVLCFLLTVCTVLSAPANESLQKKLENPAVVKFREYIQIDTSRSENLQKAVEFWRHQAEEYGLQFAVHKPVSKPICVLTWPGTEPALPSIMLNSHIDVVPAEPDEWLYPPFSAHVDEDGNIFGRGSQDTKDVSIQYLEAIGKLKRDNITLQRTIHITLMPDEETGGFEGMRPFVQSPEFQALNVGFALDEGVSTPTDDFYATYQDRRPWLMKFTVEGDGGHGFSMPENIAIVKLQRLLDLMMEYRKPLAEAVRSKSNLEYGQFTTLNINMINGGSAPNVIPQTFTLVADMRLSPKENATEMLSLVNSWIAHAGNNTKVEYLRQVMESLPTAVDESNPYWVAMNDTINQLGYKLIPIVCPATSDLVVVRDRGVPGIGFAPKHRTTARLHAAGEYLHVDVFLQGVDIYVALIEKLGNLPPN